jgi:proteasome accessory factor C
MSLTPTEQRLQRLMAMVPWIISADGPKVSEVAERFGTTEKKVVEDLEGVIMLCGVYPYTPGDLVEVDVDEDERVWIRAADWITRPLRLTPPEGLGLLGAARFAAARGTNPLLQSAISKLSAALGVDAEEVLEVELGAADQVIRKTLEESTAQKAVVEIDYYSFGRDAWETRAVEPHRVFNSNGADYAWAWCRKVEDWRLFRVDRVRRAELTGDHFEARKAPSAPAPFSDPAEGERVILELAPEARWASEEYPVESVRAGRGGWLRVELKVTEKAWLERLLLRLGPNARVVKGDDSLGATAAGRLLEAYRKIPADTAG